MKNSIISTLLISTSLLSLCCYKADAINCGKRLKIAVVDSGLDLTDPRFVDHLCETGHVNFVRNETIDDINGHGTFVTGLIQKYAGDANYCLMIYKYYSEHLNGGELMKAEVMAFNQAIKDGADIINLSGGGPSFNEDEYLAIKNHPKTIFIVAAGNNGKNIDDSRYKFYPASYFLKNEIVVGNINANGSRAASSNWSKKIRAKQVGVDVISSVPCYYEEDSIYCNKYMTGTSMSAAIETGKFVDKVKKYCESR